MAECSYADLVALIAALEDLNPFLAVSGIIVSGQEQSRVRHSITLTIEMPMVGRPPVFQTLGQKATEASPASAGAEDPKA